MTTRPVSDIAFSPTVKSIQERLGSRQGYASMERGRGWSDRITPDLAGFIAERDTFFLGTVNADGQPYIQHRGGPPGFLKVIDDQTLGFADFGGNQQYITMGNLADNERAFIFLMDFANRRRVKIWGAATVVEHDDDLTARLSDAGYAADPQRAFLFRVRAWDGNCPQHITPRFTADEVESMVQPLRQRIRELESKVESCGEAADDQGDD
jgi:predicted pyridoxine 5'-phosphate oxidase superfamily flavin-nucleotide-binding protein